MASRASKVFSLSLAQGILMLVTVVSGMVFARALSVADYGTYLQTFLAYDFAVPILTLGLPSALFYFMPGAKDRQKGLVIDNLILLFIAALIFSLFLALGGAELLAKRFNNPDLSKTLRWMIFYPIYTFPVLIGSAVWVTKDKVKLNALYNVITGVILTISLITAVLITRTYEVPTLVRICLPVIFLPVALYLIFKNVPGQWYQPSISSMWTMAKFSIPLGLATVFGTVTRQMANMIVSLLTSPEEFAIFANGAKEVPLIGIVTGSIGVVIMADMAQNVKQGDLNKALELFRKASVISATILLPVMVFLMIFAESFIYILYSSKYNASVLPFRIYLFMLPIRIVYYGSAFIALGRTKAILYRSFISLLLTAIIAYLLTKWIGFIGAAIATVAVSYIWAIPYNLISLSKSFNCNSFYLIPFERIGRIILISVISLIPASVILISGLNYLATFICGLLLFGSIYFIISFKFLPEFKEIIIPIKTKLFKALGI